MSESDLVFIVELAVKPEHVAEWRADVHDVIERMATEDTFVSCSLEQDPDDPCLFTLYERWREPSVEAFVARHMGKDYRLAYEARLPALLRAARTATVRRHLREWRRA